VLPTKFQLIWPNGLEKILLNWSITNKNCLWKPWTFFDRLSGFRADFFLEIDLWWPCLLMDWDEMSNLQREPPRDASHQVSFGQAVSKEKIFLEIDQPGTRIVYVC
jgi:hypothetical protein